MNQSEKDADKRCSPQSGSEVPEHFSRLPQSVQALVVAGLDAEVTEGFQRIERAMLDSQVEDDEIRCIEGDITRAAELRGLLTGLEAVL